MAIRSDRWGDRLTADGVAPSNHRLRHSRPAGQTSLRGHNRQNYSASQCPPAMGHQCEPPAFRSFSVVPGGGPTAASLARSVRSAPLTPNQLDASSKTTASPFNDALRYHVSISWPACLAGPRPSEWPIHRRRSATARARRAVGDGVHARRRCSARHCQDRPARADAVHAIDPLRVTLALIPRRQKQQ
jgi:hypothetical protein